MDEIDGLRRTIGEFPHPSSPRDEARDAEGCGAVRPHPLGREDPPV